jgi:hypothetical protein
MQVIGGKTGLMILGTMRIITIANFFNCNNAHDS